MKRAKENSTTGHQALREKLERPIDPTDLREAINSATGFHAWNNVKKERRGGKK